MSWRLIAVIVLALIMGLVFGGLQIASAADNAGQFGRVSQLADLGQQDTVLVQALEDERDQTTGTLPIANPKELQPWYNRTNAAAVQVQTLAAGIGGSFPANIQARVATVESEITHLGALRITAQTSQSALAVIADYAAPINDMIALNDQIAQGTSDSALVNDVQALNSLSLAKDQAAQQRALLFNALNQQVFADGVQQALTTAESEELTDLTAFDTTATGREQSAYQNTVAGPQVDQARNIESYIQRTGRLAIGAAALGISPTAASGEWYSAQSATVDDMQQVEQGVTRNIVARAQSLQGSAEQSALLNAVVALVILLLVLFATLAVARSLVRPLRKLREGALNVATVELPERVRQLGEATDAATNLEVEPIDVVSADEIGQVAWAFDQVHAQAVRVAGNEAMLRNSFNAMFVNLSRRSQSLIERLVRMIDSLEQNEDDPDRLSNLFSIDHLVTRMRRNSENLLLLAGHEGARKWSGPVPLADVARAAVSEIEQYSRVALKIQPGIAVTGPAVSDVVHLLAELIENATIFSSKDTAVQVSGQELTSGGVLVEVSDDGVGIPEARLAEINWRLDNPPVIDVSVSRHMGLFAVARLAERHGVRVRLRARAPHGLTALVWLPDSVTERGAPHVPWAASPRSRPGQLDATARPSPRHGAAMPNAPDGLPVNGLPVNGQFDVATPAPAAAGSRKAVQAAGGATAASRASNASGTTNANASGTTNADRATAASSATSDWFHNLRLPVTGSVGNGEGLAGAAAQPDGKALLAADGLAADGLAADGLAADGLATDGLGTDGWAESQHAAQIIADPVHGDRTAAGLPMRVPRANLLPGSAGGAHRAGSNEARRQPGSHETQAPTAPRAQRSPELARSRLSGFQRGNRRAKSQTPRADQGADR